MLVYFFKYNPKYLNDINNRCTIQLTELKHKLTHYYPTPVIISLPIAKKDEYLCHAKQWPTPTS